MACTKLMDEHNLEQNLESFREYLLQHNMSHNTICVYIYAVRQFHRRHHQIIPANLQLYKVFLLEHYKPQTVNLRIRAMNCYMEYQHTNHSKIPMIRIQQKMYLDRIISQADYEYLKRRLWEDEEFTYYFVIRFMAATGVRVSEVIQFQVEDVFAGIKDIYSKGIK